MDGDEASGANLVTLRGRVVGVPLERELPSGDRIITFRLSMPRERTAMTAGSRQATDWVDCVAWTARVRRTVAASLPGDTVNVEGALRRRFYRTPGGATTRLEVEALRVRRLARHA